MKTGNYHVIKLLLVFGATVNSLNSQLLTPLDVAVECCNDQAISLLQSLGAVQGEVAKKLSFNTAIPRLKSFYDTAKMKSLLAQKMGKLRDLNTNKHHINGNGYHSSSSSPAFDVAKSNGHLQCNDAYNSGRDGEAHSITNASTFTNGVTDSESSIDGNEMTNGIASLSSAGSHQEDNTSLSKRVSCHSLSHVTLKDMEDGNTFLALHERLQQCININLDLSGELLQMYATLK